MIIVILGFVQKMNSTIAINGENDTAIETNQIPEGRINNLEALFQLFVDDCASPSESLPSLYQIIALTACILLFYNARRLVNNMVAFYAAGSLLGVFGSLLLIAYLVQKLMPRVFEKFWLCVYMAYFSERFFQFISRDGHYQHTFIIIYGQTCD